MHILNNFTDEAGKLNDPVQTMFYGAHRRFLLVSGALSGLAALVLGLTLTPLAFFFILIMSILGLLYNLNIFPPHFTTWTNGFRLKEIPGAKASFTALAWGVLAALIPVVSSTTGISWATILTFFLVAGLIFIRSGLFEVLALEGDRIVGKETLAVAFGKTTTMKLLYATVYLLAASLLLGTWAGLLPSLGYTLLLCVAYAWGYLQAYERGYLEAGLLLESLVEGNLILAGWLAFLWDPYHRLF